MMASPRTILILLTLVGNLYCSDGALGSEKPNIVLILADDMGYADLSPFGSTEIKTPHLTKLARSGCTFTNAYVTAPICVASRMGLITGRYQQRFGIYDNYYGQGRHRLFLQEKTLADLLKADGYQTALFGKWHMGYIPEPYGSHPLQRGFDQYVGIPAGMSDFWKGATLFDGYKELKSPEYLTDFFGRQAVTFIERNKDHPFFLFLAFNAVHAPLHALDEDQQPYAELDSPDRRAYAGMMRSMDRNVGRVLEALKAHELEENTLVIFLNDNGGGGNHTPDHTRNTARNAPLRGFKFDVFEGGIRVPFILSWKGKVQAGTSFDKMVSSLDVLPTVLNAAGAFLPKDQELDGVDLLPFLKGMTLGTPHESLCWRNVVWKGPLHRQHDHPGRYHSAVRTGNWKLVQVDAAETENVPWQLFDLSRDIGEQHNLAPEYPDIVRRLRLIHEKWLVSMSPDIAAEAKQGPQ